MYKLRSLVTDLRREADLCRRISRVPTAGGHRADEVLRALADKFDREATVSEGQAASAYLTDDQLFDFRRQAQARRI